MTGQKQSTRALFNKFDSSQDLAVNQIIGFLKACLKWDPVISQFP